MLRTIILVVILLIILKAAILSPFGALLGYLWFALFRPQEWVWVDISSLRLSLVLGGILIFRCIGTKSWPNITHPISIGTILFLLTGLLAQTNATNQALGWEWLDFFSRLTLVCLLLITLVNTERRFYFTVMTVCTSLGYYTSKAGLASLLGGGVRFSDGLAGAFLDNNGYALAAVMIIPMLIAVSASVPSEWRFRKLVIWGYRTAVPLTAFAVVSTFSRGGLLALIAIVVAYAIFQQQKKKLLFVLIIAALAIPFLPIPEGYQERISTVSTYEETEETSAMSRLHFWKVALKMAAANPIGVGMFNFGATYNKYDFSDGRYGNNRVAHNSHLQVLAENGYVGLLLWLVMFYHSFRKCFDIYKLAEKYIAGSENVLFFKSMSIALMISMIGFVVGGSFVSLALNDLTWILFALVAALDRLYNSKISTEINYGVPDQTV